MTVVPIEPVILARILTDGNRRLRRHGRRRTVFADRKPPMVIERYPKTDGFASLGKARSRSSTRTMSNETSPGPYFSPPERSVLCSVSPAIENNTRAAGFSLRGVTIWYDTRFAPCVGAVLARRASWYERPRGLPARWLARPVAQRSVSPVLQRIGTITLAQRIGAITSARFASRIPDTRRYPCPLDRTHTPDSARPCANRVPSPSAAFWGGRTRRVWRKVGTVCVAKH